MNGMNVIEKSLNKLQLPGVVMLLSVLDWKMKLKWIFTRDKVLINKPQTQKVHVIFALFEKESFRKDVLNVFKVLKDNGCYISAINTKKIDNKELSENEHLFDRYIERFNYGRDFSSYKSGIKKFFKYKNCAQTDTLLILNDSVFYGKKNLDSWVKELIDSKVQVTGTTENLEVEHHLGSFTLAVKSKVFNNKVFKNYWKTYPDTDVRSRVIKNGELKFSKILKKCVNNLTEFKAIYNSERFHEFMHSQESAEIKENFINYNRRETLQGLGLQIPTLNLNILLQNMRRYIVEDRDLEESQTLKSRDVSETAFGKSLKILNEKDFNFISCSSDLKKYFHKNITDEYERSQINAKVEETIVYSWLETFRQGSQIHTNCIILPKMGVPFIKLDLVYRGVCLREDIASIEENLDAEESKELISILYSRPFGEVSHYGWRKVAFMNGLI